MPKERVANIVKIVNLIPIVFSNKKLIIRGLFYGSVHNCPLKSDSIAEIDLAIVNEIMCALEELYRFLHNPNIEIIFCKKVFVRTFRTVISSVELLWHLFKS